MKPLKIFYLSSEIHPFSNTYSLAKFSKLFGSYLNEKQDIDIRLCQPKYGYISDRKYILREVIRLKDLEIDFLGKKHISNLKSAFIPETRVQIYFMEHPDYFKDVQDLLYKSRNGRFFQNNHEKFLFFIYNSFETLKKLFWVPDVIVCNDWQMSLLSIIFDEKYKQNEIFKNTKIVTMIHSYSDLYNYPNQLLKDLDLSYDSKLKTQNAFSISSKYSNLNYIFDNDESLIKQLSKSPENKKLLSKRKNKVVKNFESLVTSEKIEVFDKIINDFKALIKK